MENKAQDDDLVMNLVELALDLPEQDRRAYLQNACGGDSGLFLDHAWEYVQWEARMQGFLLDPLYPPPLNEHPFEPGELLDGRFRIVREVAQGGMGVVYEAMDERLERRIAIKCAKTGFRKRLPPEVRHAREISHPHVCRIFEIHTVRRPAGEIDFVSMEYLEGETLADRLKRGPVSEALARAIAEQLCSGLAEAHRQGVIHGDLKSNNVILTKVADASTRAVITDFGMSRATEAAQSTMQSGPRGGTPDYMAPELLKGEKASVASDVYALGVLLHELVSGQKPAIGATIAAHPRWNAIVAKCLAANPQDRYPNVAQIAQAFEPPRTRRWFLIAAAATLVAALAGTVIYQRAAGPREVVRMAVLPFSSAPGIDDLGTAVTRSALASLRNLKASAKIDFRAILPPEQASTQALRATHAIGGKIEKQGEHILLHMWIDDARSGVRIKQWTAAYPPNQIQYAGVALAGLVSATFHLPPISSAVSGSEMGQRNYLAGMSAMRSDSGVDQALALMEEAAATDRDSALIQAGLGEAQWFKYFLTKDQQWLDRSAESQRVAERLNTDLAPVHRVTGLLRASMGLYENATAEYLRAIELDPNNAENFRRLGQIYEQNNQLDEALAAFQKGVNLEPTYYRASQELGAFYYNRADYASAVTPLARAASVAPGEPSVRFGLGLCDLNLGRYTDAENELRSALRLKETPTTLHALGLALLYQRREKEAIPFLEKAVMLEPDRYLSWMYLGVARRRTGQSSESKAANSRGLEAAEKELVRNPRSGYIRSFLGYFSAELGDRRRAQSEIAQALGFSPNDAETRWTALLTYEALDDRNSTLALAAAAPQQQLADLSRWPDVADLHKDSRFLQMLATHQIK